LMFKLESDTLVQLFCSSVIASCVVVRLIEHRREIKGKSPCVMRLRCPCEFFYPSLTVDDCETTLKQIDENKRKTARPSSTTFNVFDKSLRIAKKGHTYCLLLVSHFLISLVAFLGDRPFFVSSRRVDVVGFLILDSKRDSDQMWVNLMRSRRAVGS
jgi:hypothetical protein